MGHPRKTRTLCQICGKLVDNLRSTFCSNVCQNESQYRSFIERWRLGQEIGNKSSGRTLQVSSHIRRYLREKFGDRCTKCGWAERHPTTKRIPLNVEHINGDPFDSSEGNLTLLCPNCHSLTVTFGILNRGRGRTSRHGAVVQREDMRLAVSE